MKRSKSKVYWIGNVPKDCLIIIFLFLDKSVNQSKKYTIPYIIGSPLKHCRFGDGKEFEYNRKKH